MAKYQDILNHYQQPVPRYTSYPTAPQFQPGLGSSLFRGGMQSLKRSDAVSVYIHIPFCDRLCWFCGCHTKHTLKYAPISRYVETLIEELHLFGAQSSFRPKIGHLHLGGGSPSLLREDDLLSLKEALECVFEFQCDTEISVEIDPSDVESSTISALQAFGLNRASIGVQDFHPEVQKAINRPQSFEITRYVVEQLRNAGIRSINIDALYGLPLQTEERLLQTIEQCVSLAPDRMALFGYAHVPWLKKHQNIIKQEDLPNGTERFEHAQSAASALQKAEYQAIGIDHFARPDDSFAEAARNGKLRRNFQGYTADQHEALIGFGASSIGRFSDCYVQNFVPTGQYEAEVKAGKLPKGKGVQLSEEDRLRGHIIERLMCDFSISFDQCSEYSPNLVRKCFRQAHLFAATDQFNMCTLNGDEFRISDDAKAFTRIIAAQFDAYYQQAQFQYSKAV